MTTKIIPKKSTVAGKIPAATDLEAGEVAINLTDATFYSKHTDGSIVNLSGAPELHTHTISQVDNLQSSLDGKVDKVTGKGLSTEDYTTTEKNKLTAIESGATGDQTATEILTAIKTVDGSGSGLDADTLDGIDSLSFVRDTGDTLTGTYTVNTTDDGLNDLQVGGTSRFQGNAGFGDSSPDEKVDVAGNARIQNENAMKFGGTGATDAQYAIQYNAATKSLDFNFLGA